MTVDFNSELNALVAQGAQISQQAAASETGATETASIFGDTTINPNSITTDSTNAATETESTNETSKELQEKIDKLNKEKSDKKKKMDAIEKKIDELIDKVKEAMGKAKNIQEKKLEEHEEQVNDEVKKQVQAYVEANKNGEGMTRDELQANIAGAVGDINVELGGAVAQFVAANEMLDEIDDYAADLKNLIYEVKDLDLDIEGLTQQKDAADAAAAAAEQPKQSNGCCDPIGFEMTDENGESAKFDFFFDTDGDGQINSMEDFVGANGNWEAMAALDADGDGTVTGQELSEAGVKTVKTGADGTQSVVDVAELGDIAIDLNSYDANGEYDLDGDGVADKATGDADGNGVADQTLQGTFNINVGGKDITGYNTLDDTEWLANNYTYTEAAGSVAGGNGGTTAAEVTGSEFENADGTLNVEAFSQELQPYANKYNSTVEFTKQAREDLVNGYKELGFTEEEIEAIDEAADVQGSKEAAKFQSELDKIAEEKEEEEAAEESEENGEVEGDTNTEAAAAAANVDTTEPESSDNSETEDDKKDKEDEIKEAQAA